MSETAGLKKELRAGLQDWPKETQQRADELFWPHRAALARVDGYYQLVLATKLGTPEDTAAAGELVDEHLAPALDELTTLEVTGYHFLVDAVTTNVSQMLSRLEAEFPGRIADPTGSTLKTELQEHLQQLLAGSAKYAADMDKKTTAAVRILRQAVPETTRGNTTYNLVRWHEGLRHYANTNAALGSISVGEPLPGSEQDLRAKKARSSVAELLGELIADAL